MRLERQGNMGENPKRPTTNAAPSLTDLAGVKLAKDLRKTRRELQGLSDAILLFVDAADATFRKDQTVPKEAGARLARLLNALELANDQVRFFTLGVNYRTDDKAAAVAALRRKAVRG